MSGDDVVPGLTIEDVLASSRVVVFGGAASETTRAGLAAAAFVEAFFSALETCHCGTEIREHVVHGSCSYAIPLEELYRGPSGVPRDVFRWSRFAGLDLAMTLWRIGPASR